MKKTTGILCVVSILTALLPATTHANIDFDSHYPALDGSNPILEKGVRFDFNAAAWGIFSPSSGACCNVNYNGTPALFVDGNYGNLAGGSNANVVLTSFFGEEYPYSTGFIDRIYGFDASTYWTGATGKLDVIGRFYDGKVVTASFDIDSTWKHFVLPDTFIHLVDVEFRDSQSGAFLSAPGFGLDNIVIDVPEPQAYAMLLAGIGLIGFFSRKKDKFST